MISGHGNNLYQYGEGVIKIDFSSNIAFNNNSDAIIEFLKNNLSSIKNYPDPSAKILTDKLSIHNRVSSQEILVVNGSAEAFFLVAHFLSNIYPLGESRCNTLIYTPSFAEYEDSCKLYKHDLHYDKISDFTDGDFTNFNSVWLATPNNPDGYCVKSHEIVSKCIQYTNCYFVVDVAYSELGSSNEFEGRQPDNLILINSLTKSFGIPGIRLGYVIASEGVIEMLHSMRPPWSVNSLSLLSGEYIMDNYASLQPDRDELIKESKFIQYNIDNIDGFKVIESECNFFLCEITSQHNAEELHQYLIDNYGILIRDASNFRSLSYRYFRVAAQSRHENEQLIKALEQWKVSK